MFRCCLLPIRVVWCWWVFLLVTGCSPGEGQQEVAPFEFHGSTMGATYTIKVLKLPTDMEERGLDQAIRSILGRLHAQMSTYDANSEIGRFNSSHSTDWIPVSEDVCAVVTESLRVSRLSGGAFDITVGPVVDLWGFGPDPSRTEPPAETDIRRVMQRVGYQHLQTRCDEPALRKDRPDIAIDLSAIAQGYGADKVAEYLDVLGVRDYLVDVGGELRARGVNPRGVPWRIGIEKPTPKRRVVERVVQVKNCAIATSGTYRNFFEQGGRRFSHTIDPHTGAPVTHGLASVTVITTQGAAAADALATAISVLGPERGYDLAVRENLAVLLIVQKGAQYVEKSSPQIAQYLTE